MREWFSKWVSVIVEVDPKRGTKDRFLQHAKRWCRLAPSSGRDCGALNRLEPLLDRRHFGSPDADDIHLAGRDPGLHARRRGPASPTRLFDGLA